VNRTQRSALLAAIPEPQTVRLAETVADGSLGDVQIITPPTVGMIMARVQDGARDELFNLGEVLVTEARVSVAGHEGWALVMGGSFERALAAAIVDASLEAGHTQRDAIERELEQLAQEQAALELAEWQRVAATKVEFDTF
jgi:alpha-D-ribose 1-methylphosphonate 5-triphosphate synthase subunit PhnG